MNSPFPSWMISAFKMEWRNILSYRIDFWINFVGITIIQFLVAYFLWTSIFSTSGVTEIKGMSFPMLMLYYILAPLTLRATSGLIMGFMFNDIYSGGLNKYLLYPLSYINFKLVTQYARTLFYLLQILLVFILFTLFFPIPAQVELSLLNSILFLLTIIVGGYLYFMLASIFEMISFWADNIWSLMVMLRIIISIFGGLMIPLHFFPTWAQQVLNLLPFRYLISFPIRTFLGQLSTSEIALGFSVMIFWAIILTGAVQIMWKKGNRQYSGIGI